MTNEIKTIEFNGGTYTGQLNADGKPHGKGKEYWSNGNLAYEGEFEDGKKHGEGKLYDEDENLKYEGEFENGEIKNNK